VLKRPLIVVVRNSTERPESIEAGFAHLVQPGPVISDLGRQLIGDEDLSEWLQLSHAPTGTERPANGSRSCCEASCAERAG
jgi:UDP-N-acetylglucosamine 2-epimerase (non-hydrolysing)